MALTDAERLQIVSMALMRHSVVGGGGLPSVKYKYKIEYGKMQSAVTAFATSTFTADPTTYAPSKAFDGSTSTYWSAQGYVNQATRPLPCTILQSKISGTAPQNSTFHK